MITMSPLEKDVMAKMLNLHLSRPDLTKRIIDSLVIKSREFSQDALDKEKCVGFYLNFADNDLLKEVDGLPHHISLHADRAGLPTGGDFLLFFNSVGGVDFLEASFYGHALPVSEITNANHAFQIDK